ncbi:hypothetical protein NECID01_1144 [Nematocida sp. AWRm77]|nr:hypothetical protein NECID01_1144 [Nematocida sp. AWRm77]
MKREAPLGKRKPLEEKKYLGCIRASRCSVCGKGIVLEKDPVSGVKCTFLGFKYLWGEEYMIVQESTQLTVQMYSEKHMNRARCTCAAVQKTSTPVGTVFNLNRPFGCEVGCLKTAQRFQPVFTEYAPYAISVDSIIRKIDTRTTCMIRNLPNKLTTRQLIVVLSSIYYNAIDFLYLRMDFKSKCNNGYAFVNFREAQYIPIFLEAIQGKRWKNFKSEKRGDIAYARIQGLGMLQNRFKRSDILGASPEYWPVIFDADGNEVLASKWKSIK